MIFSREKLSYYLNNSKISGVMFIGFILILWEISAKYMQAVSFPVFSQVVLTFFQLMVSGELPHHLGASLSRLFAGYFIASICGVTIGILMGSFKKIYNLLEPLTELIRPIPSPAYIPLAILFLGIGEQMRIFTIALASFFPILLNTYMGVKSVDQVQKDTGRTFGLSPIRNLFKIIIPASSPFILTGLRISLAISLILVVIAEMVAANQGLGYFILNMQRVFRVKEMYAGIIILGLLGYFLNTLFIKIEQRILHWHYGQD